MWRPPGPAHLRGPGRALRMEVAAGAPVRHGRRGRRRGRRAAAQAAPLVMVRLQLLAQRGRQRGLRLAPGRGVLRGAARARVASRTQLSLAARILLCTDPPGIAWQPARGGTALGAHSALWCTGVVQLAADRSAPAQSWPLAGAGRITQHWAQHHASSPRIRVSGRAPRPAHSLCRPRRLRKARAAPAGAPGRSAARCPAQSRSAARRADAPAARARPAARPCPTARR